MLTTSGCRVQPTARRRRNLRSVCRSFSLLLLFLLYAPARGLAAPLEPWHGPVPPLPSATIDDVPLVSENLPGRIVLVHFFATWCEPCGPELQALNRLHSAFGERLSIIAIDVGEPRDRVLRFLDKSPVNYPVALDQERKAARAWGVYALPSTFVLNANLAPLWQALGDVDWDGATVKEQLADAMKPQPGGSRP